MIIGKNSFVKGFALFVVLVLAVLNIIGVTFSHSWVLIAAGVITSALVIWACIRKYREYENESNNIKLYTTMETKKIDFTKSLIDFDGKEVIDNNAPMTFKGIVSRLLAMCKADDKVMERWELAQRIYKSEGELEITPSQILLIKNAIKESNLTTLVAGQVYHLLN